MSTLAILKHLSQSWAEETMRTLAGIQRGLTEPYPLKDDPPPVTPYEVVYEGGKVRLRYYRAEGLRQPIPLVLVYALIKRPYILDLLPDKSVIHSLVQRGFAVYLTDWLPPTQADTRRGFDAYVNEDLVNAVRVVQQREGREAIPLLGYCLGGVLATLYTALHPASVSHLLTLALPLDMSVREIPFNHVMAKLHPRIVDLITSVYGNCPAWLVKTAFMAMAPVHHSVDKHVSLYRNQEREGYAEMFRQFEQWMNSDVPIAGQLFRELAVDHLQENLLVQGRFRVGAQRANLQRITCPLLNIVAAYDDVVHPKSSLPLAELTGSTDTRTMVFPVGHIGAAVSSAVHTKLWPQVGAWLRERVR